MAVKAAGLREPEFIGGEVDLRINIYRGQVATNNAIINAISTIFSAIGVNYGIYTFPDGEKYDGQWFQDQQHGRGIYYFMNNNRYDGMWYQD